MMQMLKDISPYNFAKAKILNNFFCVGLTPLSTFASDVAARGVSH